MCMSQDPIDDNTDYSYGLGPSSNKPLPEPTLTQIYVVIWRH